LSTTLEVILFDNYMSEYRHKTTREIPKNR